MYPCIQIFLAEFWGLTEFSCQACVANTFTQTYATHSDTCQRNSNGCPVLWHLNSDVCGFGCQTFSEGINVTERTALAKGFCTSECGRLILGLLIPHPDLFMLLSNNDYGDNQLPVLGFGSKTDTKH